MGNLFNIFTRYLIQNNSVSRYSIKKELFYIHEFDMKLVPKLMFPKFDLRKRLCKLFQKQRTSETKRACFVYILEFLL